MTIKQNIVSIGRVFTPLKWATWCVENFNIYESWRGGSTVFDPTCGKGVFFFALLSVAQRRCQPVRSVDMQRLFGVEIVPGDKLEFLDSIHSRFGIEFPTSNFFTMDFMNFKGSEKFDIAIGNPPWVNFSNLTSNYKERMKTCFIEYGLVKNRKDVLLGASRADLASLVIQKCMRNHIRQGGSGFFFVPLSLFFNEDANKYFRPIEGEENIFSVKEIYDFENKYVFDTANTRNGFVILKKESRQVFPVPINRIRRNSEPAKLYCAPSSNGGPWMQSNVPQKHCEVNLVRVDNNQVPRQGMNTGGLNKVFVLEREKQDSILDPIERFINGYGISLDISTDFVFPLMNSALFGGRVPKKERYILCLHDQSGSPLTSKRISELSGVLDYLNKYENEMRNRKGVLIQSCIRRGYFWSLIGVGPYSFSPFKVAWESLGKRSFSAVVVDGRWQGNQAMHAYIPAYNSTDAFRIRNKLNENVPAYLHSFGMEGTCNWAQPGRIKRLLSVYSDQRGLFNKLI